MKKILLVCDQLAESGLRHLLQGQVDAGQFKVFHQKSAAPQLQVITRESAWEATCFLSPEKEKIVQVFILVELNRSDWPSLRSGYTLAEKMLQRDDLKDQILNLQFISLYSRRELRDRAPALHQPFVKYFPHLNYRPKQLLPINFSLREYRFFRNYCLTESGQMDILAHDLRKYTQDSYPAQDLLVQVKRTLELRAAVVGHLAFAKAAQLVAQLELDASPENCRLVQQQHLPVLIELLSQRRDENQAGETPHKMPYKALIVEDDPRQLKKLETALGPYFEAVTGLTDGSVAYDTLKKGGYHALFVDMELLDADGFNQPVTGIHLIDLCENEPLPIATRIVTALGRRGLKELVDKPESHILHKSYSDRILGGNENMAVFLKNLAQEIKRKQEISGSATPSTGPFGEGKFLKNLYFRLETEREPELAQLMLEIQKKAEDFFLHRTGPAEIEMEFGQTQSLGREKEDLKLLKTVLLHRAIALLHTKKSPDGWINFGHYEQFDPKKDLKYSDLHEGYGDLFDPRLADDHKKYFVTQLGFSGHWENTERNTRTNCVWVQVATDKMFKAERDWYDTLDIVHLTEKPLQEEMPAFFKALLCLVEKIAKIPDVARDLLVKILHLNDLRKSQLEDFWEDLLDAGDSIDHQSWPSIERELAALIRPNLPPKPPKTP